MNYPQQINPYNNQTTIFNQSEPEKAETTQNINTGTKITVENYDLVNKVQKILQMPNQEDRTEALGETLFYFLLAFIPQYNINTTQGKVNDTIICSKLTGILIKTDERNLIEIISRTDRLVIALRDVMAVKIYVNIFRN
jgi:hypothetical protein